MTKLRRIAILATALTSVAAIQTSAGAAPGTSTASGPQTKALTVIGPFTIRAVHSGKCLDVVGGPGATGDGHEVQQFRCLGFGQTNQHWYFVEVDRVVNPYYNLVPRHAAFRCLDVVGGPDASQDGARVQQFTCLGPAQFNQHWHWFSTDSIRIGADGYLVSRHSSGKCLDVIGGPRATGDGVRVQQWTCLAQTNQKWHLSSI